MNERRVHLGIPTRTGGGLLRLSTDIHRLEDSAEILTPCIAFTIVVVVDIVPNDGKRHVPRCKEDESPDVVTKCSDQLLSEFSRIGVMRRIGNVIDILFSSKYKK